MYPLRAFVYEKIHLFLTDFGLLKTQVSFWGHTLCRAVNFAVLQKLCGSVNGPEGIMSPVLILLYATVCCTL
jgi:hypothetical protein